MKEISGSIVKIILPTAAVILLSTGVNELTEGMNFPWYYALPAGALMSLFVAFYEYRKSASQNPGPQTSGARVEEATENGAIIDGSPIEAPAAADVQVKRKAGENSKIINSGIKLT